MNVFESAERILLGLAGTVTEATGTILGDARVVAGGKVLSAGADKVERSMRAGAAPAKGAAGGSADAGARVKGITVAGDASIDRVAAALRPRPKTTMEETTLEAPAPQRSYDAVQEFDVSDAGEGSAEDFGGDDWTSLVSA